MVAILGANSVSGGYEIDNSLRFNDGDASRLAFTPDGAGDRDTFTISLWFKRGVLGSEQRLFSAGPSLGTSNNNISSVRLQNNDQLIIFGEISQSVSFTLQTNRVFRDSSAWYHIVVAFDTENGTAANRIKLYVNGVQESSFSTANYMSQNVDTFFNAANVHNISYTGGNYFDGYIAEFNSIDGQQLAPSDFGETDDNGVWIPKEYTGSYGTNGFYLDFSNDATKHAIAVVGNAKHSTTQNKIGATSISFDGNGDRLDIPASKLMETDSGTIECWVYMNALVDGSELYYHPPIYAKGNVYQSLTVRANGKVASHLYTGSVNDLVSANAISTGEWVHLAVTWNDAGRKIWINGVLNGTSDVSLTAMDAGGNNATFHIGEGTADSHTGLNAYVDELRVSKIVRYTSNFTPYTSALTEDSNTTLLIHSDTDNNSTTFTDSSGVIGGPGNDQSGNENHYTPFALGATDVTTDTPTNNFATFNPLGGINSSGKWTFSEGNTQIQQNNNNNWRATGSTMAVANGKWYWEIEFDAGTMSHIFVGVHDSDVSLEGTNRWVAGSTLFYNHEGGEIRQDGTNTTADYGVLTAGDILGVALNMDDKQISFYDNGNAIVSNFALSSSITGFAMPTFLAYSSNVVYKVNFGNPAFGISSGNSDANGHGNFEYAVPSGYFALCSKNLAEFG